VQSSLSAAPQCCAPSREQSTFAICCQKRFQSTDSLPHCRGFALGVGFELLTGVPTLQQIGIVTPNPTLGKLLIVFPTGLSLIFLARTLDRARKGKMSAIEVCIHLRTPMAPYNLLSSRAELFSCH
jgi:hypothetical protein